MTNVVHRFGHSDFSFHMICFDESPHMLERFFPTCEVRVVRFYKSCPSPFSLLPSPSSLLLPLCVVLLFAVIFAIIFASCMLQSCRSQWAAPDLNTELQIAVGSARRELASGVGSAGPGPAEKICQKICQKECQKICRKICKTCSKAGRYGRKNVRRYVKRYVRMFVSCHGGDHSK